MIMIQNKIVLKTVNKMKKIYKIKWNKIQILDKKMNKIK